MPSLATASGYARSAALRFSLAAVAIAIANVVVAWQERARERDQLAMLDARMLEDVGLTPGDLYQATNEAYWER